ncbi:hypothetical protein LTR27_010253 [Elasticomyces elasticus]|nr:hypothetical protein LTR27_010253 [Elasticomyces elasticus]
MSVSNRRVTMLDLGASDTASMMENQERLGDDYEAAYRHGKPRFDAGLMPQTEDDDALNAYLEAAKSPADIRSGHEDHNLLDILKHQQQLERNVALLATPSEDDTAKDRAVLACSRSLEMLRRFVVAGLKSDPLKMLPTQTSGRVAEKVFAVPELTEMILMELSPARLLSGASVCKAFEGAIVSSTKLQDNLGLRALENSIWKSPFNSRGPNGGYHGTLSEVGEMGETLQSLRDSLKCHIMDTEKARWRAVNRNVVTMRAVFQSHESPDVDNGPWGYQPNSRPLPVIGDRGRAILLCQPPIKEMFILASCCRTRFGTSFEPLAPTIRNDNGLTVGDILDATIEGIKRHESCRYAAKRHHKHDGMVDCRICFEGTVQLRADDPRLPAEMRPDNTGARGDGRDYSDPEENTPYSEDESIEPEHYSRNRSFYGPSERDALDDYIDYKREDRTRGEEIPTLAEFQAWQAE